MKREEGLLFQEPAAFIPGFLSTAEHPETHTPIPQQCRSGGWAGQKGGERLPEVE